MHVPAYLKRILVIMVLLGMNGCGDLMKQNRDGDPGMPSDPGVDSVVTTVDTVSKAPEIMVAETAFPEKVYWGDLNLHSDIAGGIGVTGATPNAEAALQFARGEEVTAATGMPIRLNRPLDWLTVTENSNKTGENLAYNESGQRAEASFMDVAYKKTSNFTGSVWDANVDLVEKYNAPGVFTAFIAFDWASEPNGGNNLHRNVIYRDGPDMARQVMPMTTRVSENPVDLWKWMEGYEEKTGGSVLAIPHNGNLSNGLMFRPETLDGSPLTPEIAALRNKYETLYEITQSKGTSETHMSLFPLDAFAYYELWDRGNLRMVPKEKGMLRYEYARQALLDGLNLEEKLGVNPFKYGFVGGTDGGLGLPMAEEDNYLAAAGHADPEGEPWGEKVLDFPSGVVYGWELGASGYTGIWATANTRTALWDALKRRETYATTGPRITVRFFGGFGFTQKDMDGNMAENGYEKGVPMGGELAGTPGGKAPSFMIAAAKDPQSGNLDRVQVIKGWLDAGGKARYKIYNAVWGDAEKRKPMAAGILPDVGSTVDLGAPGWDDSIGDPELRTLWTDPDFDPNFRAFYYLRVLEIPTPRWTAYKAVRDSLEITGDVIVKHQERAFTSPIWYSPY